MTDADDLLELLVATADSVRDALDGTDDWGLAGTIPGQHKSDLVADAAALDVLDRAGVGVLSEESGLHGADAQYVVVVDPLDGSTNAAHGIPWFATSLCAVDDDGPIAALVVNLALGASFSAVRGGGAWSDGERLGGSDCRSLGQALVLLSGYPGSWLGWRQYRALGAAALDLCLVAAGRADAYLDCSRDAHGPWDYLGGLLICQEAGVELADLHGRELVVLEHEARRTPIAAATPQLWAEVHDRRAADTG